MIPDPAIKEAIEALARARKAFDNAAKTGLIIGNDNHIGDVGEYWVRKFFEGRNEFKTYAPSKNSPFDIELLDGTKVSVKTITQWSDTGYGTQIKPLCGTEWQVLAAVQLDQDLYPSKIALIKLNELLRKEPFVSNAERRDSKGTSAYPRFQWWDWLDEHIVYENA